MKDEYDREEYEENQFPLAYLMTFRTYGTWLHGDERRSVDLHGKNVYGTPKQAPNEKLRAIMLNEMKHPPFVLNAAQRTVVEAAVRELCDRRSYVLWAINARTNHVHSVVSVNAKPERIINAFKAAATKKLREAGLVRPETKLWSRGRSRPYLWKQRDLERAIDYVDHGQGDIPFDIRDEDED